MGGNKLRDFWESTAKKFAGDGFKAVCTPTSIGLVNWYGDFLQRKALKSIFQQWAGAKVIDIGCGIGRWSLRLLEIGADVTGVDIAENMVTEASKRQLMPKSNARAKFLVAVAASLPFKDKVFDYALSVTVLQHIVDEEEVRRSASEIIRVVKAGGMIILLEISPQRRQPTKLDFPAAFRSTADWVAIFTEKQDTQLERIGGVDLSVFVKPLDIIKSKFSTGMEYTQQLSGNSSVKFALIKGLYYALLNIAILLSLPLDLVLRGKLVNQCTHKLFVFKKN
jgi:ubiquinone/menaquinone biosynthesis C-methylase UbiE